MSHPFISLLSTVAPSPFLHTIPGQSQPAVKNVMTLNTCASIVGAEVMSFEKEDQLLLRWRDLLLESDPDVIIGYNITNFDLPYLYERAQTLGIDKEFHQAS